MSKASRKPAKGNKKVTDYFTRSMVATSPTSSLETARPDSSQPTPAPKSRAPLPSQSQKKAATTAKDRRLQALEADVISLSSGSAGHISVSSGSRSHITISSSTSAPVVLTASDKANKLRSSNSDGAMLKKNSKARVAQSTVSTPSSARTTVRRNSQRLQNGPKSSRPAKRKFSLESDPEIPDIEMVPLPGSLEHDEDAASEPHHSSSPGPPSSIPPLTPKDQLQSLPSDDATSFVSQPASKRARLTLPSDFQAVTAMSTAMSGNEADVEDVIPTSQSDDLELTFPKQVVVKDPQQTRIEVDRWRQGTAPGDASPMPIDPPPFDPSDIPMDIDMDATVSESVTLDISSADSSFGHSTDGKEASAESQTSESDVSEQLAKLKSPVISEEAPAPEKCQTDLDYGEEPSQPMDTHPATPPPVEVSAAAKPPPVSIDTATKTKSYIDAMRAEVMAGVGSSPTEEVPAFRGELTSDDELQDDFLSTPKLAKKTNVAKPPIATRTNEPDGAEPQPESSKYSLRRRSLAADRAATLKMPRLVSVADDSRRASSSKKKVDPLDALLREKKQSEKRCGGSEALAEAEAAAAEAKRHKKKARKSSNPAYNADDDPSLADEDAAIRLVHQRLHGASKFDSDDEHEDDIQLGASDYKKFLGKNGHAVGKILERDRQGDVAADRKARQIRGIPLWLPIPLQLSTSKKKASRKSILPSLPFDEATVESSTLLSALAVAAARSDVARIALMLRPECIALVPAACRAPLFYWLYDIAFRDADANTTFSVFRTLEHLSSRSSGGSITLTNIDFVKTLIRLGAQPDALRVMDLDVTKESMDEDRREFLLLQLVSLVVSLSRNERLPAEELPDILLSLLCVALDVTTPRQVQDEIIGTVNTIIFSIEDSDAGRSLESEIAYKVLAFMDDLQPVNKAYLLSFFNRGCKQSCRCSRWIARACLLQSESSSIGSYCDLPSLRPLISMLSPAVGSQTAFDIPGKMLEDGYFHDLYSHVEMLNIVLCDIYDYVREEAKALRSDASGASGLSTPDSPRKGSSDKSKSELETIRTLLEKLHGKIVDTRAADLERSRVKAALQHLGLRVHYQRKSYLNSSAASGNGVRRPHNLREHWSSTPTSTSRSTPSLA